MSPVGVVLQYGTRAIVLRSQFTERLYPQATRHAVRQEGLRIHRKYYIDRLGGYSSRCEAGGAEGGAQFTVTVLFYWLTALKTLLLSPATAQSRRWSRHALDCAQSVVRVSASWMEDHVKYVAGLCLLVLGALVAMGVHVKLWVQPARARELRALKGSGYKHA